MQYWYIYLYISAWHFGQQYNAILTNPYKTFLHTKALNQRMPAYWETSAWHHNIVWVLMFKKIHSSSAKYLLEISHNAGSFTPGVYRYYFFKRCKYCQNIVFSHIFVIIMAHTSNVLMILLCIMKYIWVPKGKGSAVNIHPLMIWNSATQEKNYTLAKIYAPNTKPDNENKCSFCY